MANHASLSVIQPVPHFPVLRSLPSWAKSERRIVGQLSVFHQSMFYVPKLFKSLDARWLFRAIVRRLGALHSARPIDLIDAHFGYPDGVGCYLAARRLRIPFFVTLRGLEADYLDHRLIR